MTRDMAEGLAAVLAGQIERSMPASRTWGVLTNRPDGRLACIEEHAGWAYRDRATFEAFQGGGEPDALVAAEEWGQWDGGEGWARGLSRVLGSSDCWHSGGGIWLVFYLRPDGKFAVIGSESGAVYTSRDEFEADEVGELGENFALA